MTRRLISVHCGNRTESPSPAWSALEALVPVRFCFEQDSSEPAGHPLILTEPNNLAIAKAVTGGRPVFVFSSRTDSDPRCCPVAFSRDPILDPRIRGQTLRHECIRDFIPLKATSSDSLLAFHDDKPIWLRRQLQGVDIHFVGVPFPVLGPGELPFDYLNGGRFIHLLPLLHFLRQVAGDDGWRPPALRACMMFDDPNLHWSSYGFLPFGEATVLANQFNFHIACATVPLDSWYVHGPTAALFRQNGNRISLLMHGNDHVLQELGRVYGDDGEVQLLAQALQRIEGLERRAGFRVSRVMAPPHGACHPAMARAMLRLGFDGACVSPWSLRDWGGDRKWPCGFGLQMAEMIEQFPVVPRFLMDPGCEGWIVVNAFLNRPIIPLGHHHNVSDGLDLLVKLADRVNSLPNVEWCNLEQILLSNYLVRREGSTLCVRPFTARIRAHVPHGVTSLRIENGAPNQVRSLWRLDSPGGGAGETEFAVSEGTEVELHLDAWGRTNYRDVRPLPSSTWAPVRRILCELRDRVRPLLHGTRNVNASV